MQGDAYDIDGFNNTWDITPYTQYLTESFDEHQNQYFTTVAVVSIIGIVIVAITIIIFRRRKQ